jgi:hypothetical protein
MRYIFILLIGAVLIAGCSKQSQSSGSSNQDSSVISNWTPPQSPNPQKILNEADADTQAGQYTNALAKYVWFYQNALKYDPAQRGVRVSFALKSWAELGAVYPPALNKLKAVRDEAAENVRQGKDAVSAFQDFVAINATLKDDDNTSDFFTGLDANKPDVAKVVFDRTQHWLLPALVKTKKYSVCGKYINPDTSFKQILKLYRTMMEQVNQGHVGSEIKNFADQNFINKTTTLIAILVIDDRRTGAEQIVDKISKESDLPEFKEQIDKALSGEVPTQFP